tara:strand:+ start:707 stop:1117 length:411 start_codon:yes stop_codon:yes gene_type:complete
MIIKAIKETLGQMFYSPEATGSWVIEEENIECAIDEETVDCSEVDSTPYVGVPAPAYLEDDEWFGPAPVRTEKQLEYMEMETEMKKQEEEQRKEYSGEPCNMHQLMYEMATSNWNTVAETQGGSENFQGGSENVQR